MPFTTIHLLLFIISISKLLPMTSGSLRNCSMKHLTDNFRILINYKGKIITRWEENGDKKLFELKLMPGTLGKEYSAFSPSNLSINETDAFMKLPNNYWFHGKRGNLFGVDLEGGVWSLSKGFPESSGLEMELIPIEIPADHVIHSYQAFGEKIFIYTKNRVDNKTFLYSFNEALPKASSQEVQRIPRLITPLDDYKLMVVFGPFYTVIPFDKLQYLDNVHAKDIFSVSDIIDCFPEDGSNPFWCLNDRVDALRFFRTRDAFRGSYLLSSNDANHLARFDGATFLERSAFFVFVQDKVWYNKKTGWTKKCTDCQGHWFNISEAFPGVKDKITAAVDYNSSLYIITRSRVYVYTPLNVTDESFEMKLQTFSLLSPELNGLEAAAVYQGNFYLSINGSIFASTKGSFSDKLLHPFTRGSGIPHTFSTRDCVNSDTKFYYNRFLQVHSDQVLREIKLQRAKEKMDAFYPFSSPKPKPTKKLFTPTQSLLIMFNMLLANIIGVLFIVIVVLRQRIARIIVRDSEADPTNEGRSMSSINGNTEATDG